MHSTKDAIHPFGEIYLRMKTCIHMASGATFSGETMYNILAYNLAISEESWYVNHENQRNAFVTSGDP